MGLDDLDTDFDKAQVVVLPAPYEATCSWGAGASLGPEAIIRASAAAEFFDEELNINLETAGVATLPALPIQKMTPEEMVDTVRAATLSIIEKGKIPAGLGGEHTVTVGFLQAVATVHPAVSVLQIDAHPDLRDSYEGRKICHATVGRRIIEFVSPLVQVGVRAISLEENIFIKEEMAKPDPRIIPFSAYAIRKNPDWISKVVDALGDQVYLTFDLDGFDSSTLPHTGTPEPGGLQWRDACDLIAAVSSQKKIVGFDIVELAPDASSRASDFTAARLALRLIGHCLTPGCPPPYPAF